MSQSDSSDLVPLFSSIGLEETVAKNATRNAKFARTLVEIIKEAGVENGCPKSQGNLLYNIASKFPANALVHRPVLVKYVTNESVKTVAQLDGAYEYLRGVGSEPITLDQLESSAGIGVVVTGEQISAAVSSTIASFHDRLKEERYRLNSNILLGAVTKQLKWADGAAIRLELDAQILALLGPKTEEDLKPLEKKPKSSSSSAAAASSGGAASAASSAGTNSKSNKSNNNSNNATTTSTANAATTATTESETIEDPYAFLPKPTANNNVHTTVNFSDGRIMRIANSAAQLAQHLALTQGKVITRFPPEPNGYLHIGHAKAMFVDFGMAVQYGGDCYLRFDDTNPNAEKEEYIHHIEEIVQWMGWKPAQITYSSDYFQQLYDFAVQLIKDGNAYVCHQTKDQIEASREAREPSPWRDRPIQESLDLFDRMRRGLVEEGKATLRMKMDHKNENYNMFDLIAYRIKFARHPHAGDKWCVYPSYDYTHCLVDALENVTHSLCTLEFETRRASYYWLLEVLGTYKPLVWEYARLNITNNVLSKRKLNKLVTDGHVRGWDDPRLLTLAGLRRRGVPSSALNNFCREVGITRNSNTIPMHRLDHHIRAELEVKAPRALAVLRPLKVTVTNWPADKVEMVEAREYPGRADLPQTYPLPFSRVIYVEKSDFREQDTKDYFGLAPGKSAMLRYGYPITVTGVKKDNKGEVVELEAEYDPDFKGKKPPKGVLNWVAQPAPGVEPSTFEARLYDLLFNAEDPAAMEDWLEHVNQSSLEVLTGCLCDASLLKRAESGKTFQFERLGYFCLDVPDAVTVAAVEKALAAGEKPTEASLASLQKSEVPVFNRTVTLKEAAAAKAAKK
eukprot:CAMPEP_0175064682 /NCGR_PEP_ID=MMETSP0052_2-20121109/15477_1 /TAXON_ID=51329 ORGANISM="Polytomella parva, Strain SAG 63-3" /NCGR_SAMPLE_ID=MMETSP0052_2 /ASSEMBLY_ACC=CAM_ASM_000194 /LENGTH=850 /DNA_ID=CAMNT_0016331077 /DNA_START=254 /DNA_END=2806 /DNA_ORIENTATION=-